MYSNRYGVCMCVFEQNVLSPRSLSSWFIFVGQFWRLRWQVKVQGHRKKCCACIAGTNYSISSSRGALTGYKGKRSGSCIAIFTRNRISALYNLGSANAAIRCTVTQINHTRPSPRKQSPDGTTSTEIADTRLLLTTHLSISKG